MKFEKSKIINASAERTWEVVAHDFADVGLWSSAVAGSSPNLEAGTPDGATVGGRVCATPGFGDLNETFTKYSEKNRDFTFEVSGMPSFITMARNNVTVRPVGSDRAEVHLSITMETNAIGKDMGPMFAVQLKATLNTFLDKLAAYIETGDISKKKQKMLAKVAA
jgi:hypothetical protein